MDKKIVVDKREKSIVSTILSGGIDMAILTGITCHGERKQINFFAWPWACYSHARPVFVCLA